MSQTAASFVYTGGWINWSRGIVLGSTVTLSERDGDLLIAFLSMFVAAAGAACWKIVSFAIHQHRSLREPQDGIHHQQQAIFRNTGSPSRASFELAQLAWSWRKHAIRPFVRTLPLMALALFIFSVFGVAGIFSSEVAKAAGNETLIRSPDCGYLNFNETTLGSPQALAALNSVEVNDTLAATTYSRACYGNSQNPLQCMQYPQSQLHWKINQNATCPFPNDLCFYGGSSAYEMDTGLIDSHQALGINAPKFERVQYRKVTTCSPIHTRGYATIVNDTDPGDLAYGQTFQQFSYGPSSPDVNYTYKYNIVTESENLGYALMSYVYFAGLDTNSWSPIDALNRTDADVSLFLLALNSVYYQNPVTDPFFNASIPENVPSADGANSAYYVSERPVNALACIDQHQYCNPTNKQCTPLNSYALTHVSLNENRIGLNEDQMVTLLRLDFIPQFLSTYASVNSRGANALRASETLNGLVGIALPNNQWMTEVNTWFAVSMAKLQQKVIQYAMGPGYIPDGMTLARPIDQQTTMCKNQIVRSSTGYTSFSVLGLAIILIIGAALISTSLVLPSLIGLLRQWLRWKEHKSLQWTVDGKFQLQRLAYEEAGQGHWGGGAKSVPWTRKSEAIGLPEGVDSVHPRLGRVRMHSDGGSVASRTPESESLMGDKGARYKTEAVAAQHGY